MYRFVKLLIEKIYAPVLLRYLQRDRYYSFRGIRILVKKKVFHPGFFFSTRFLLGELAKMDLRNKRLLELGAGSGLISFYAARNGALVTASDISATAVEGLRENARELQLPVEVVHSDLFRELSPASFDFIVINPPYYPKNAANEAELAWFCGAEFEYFHRLFAQLRAGNCTAEVWMSLSEDCNIAQIAAIANQHCFNLETVKKRRILWEKNYIFSIR